MAIIVELVAQDEHTLALHSFDADSISIGRSLDNDFVVSDPYVDPHHLRVSVGETPSTFLLEDRNTLNGSRLGRRRLSGVAQPARSGSVLHIGKTSLRISDSSSSVEPAQKLTAVDGFYDWAASSLVCMAVLATVLLYASFGAWIGSDASMQPAQYFEKLSNPLGTLMVTAAFWAIVGRIVKRRVNFVAHLTIAALTQFIVLAWLMLMSIVTVNLSMVTLLPVLSFLGRGVVFVASIELHLRLATNVTARRRLVFEMLVLVVMFIYPIYKQINAASEFRAFAPYNSSLLPRSLQFYGVTTTEDFMVKAERTMEAARELALEKKEAALEGGNVAEAAPGEDAQD
jgi:pSer/pThr/pTyr-binding forkhead associated (FHA) protein